MNTKLFPAPAALAATLVGALALALGPAVAAGAAPAQEGNAVLTVEAAHPADGGVHFIVLLTQDGDPVNGATVLATPATADEDQLAPVTLVPADDGQYEGFVSFPSAGTWTVRIASDDPAASLTKTVDVAVSPSTSGPPAGSNGGGFTPAQDGTGTSSTESSDSAGGPPIALIAGLAVLVLAAATAAVVVTRRRQAASTPAPPIPRTPQRKAKATAKPEAKPEATEADAATEAAAEAKSEAPDAAEAAESENADKGEGGAADTGKVEAT